MDLKDWLIKNKMSQGDFAKLIGFKSGRFQVNRFISKTRIPSRKAALKIQEVTNGEVTAYDLLFLPRLPIKENKPDETGQQQQEKRHDEHVLDPYWNL
jgi:hypothetical protein